MMPFMEETEGSKKTFISQLGEKWKKLKCPFAIDIGEGRKGKMATGRLISFDYIPKTLY